jgi:hypothetical protein
MRPERQPLRASAITHMRGRGNPCRRGVPNVNRSGRLCHGHYLTIDTQRAAVPSRTSTARAGPIMHRREPGLIVAVPNVNRSGRPYHTSLPAATTCPERQSLGQVLSLSRPGTAAHTSTSRTSTAQASPHHASHARPSSSSDGVPNVQPLGQVLSRGTGDAAARSRSASPERQPLGQALSHWNAGAGHHLGGRVPNVNRSGNPRG